VDRDPPRFTKSLQQDLQPKLFGHHWLRGSTEPLDPHLHAQ